MNISQHESPAIPAVATSPEGRISAAARAHARPTWIDRGRIPSLDGLRALSITLVIGEHLAMAHGFRPTSMLGELVGHLGSIGVDIFFAISGFLITTLLLREWRAHQTISLRAFYIRRFLRIMPAAVLFMLAIAAAQLLGHADLTARNWLHVATYTVNFDPQPAWETGHLWSLSIEEHFYFLWPLALLVVRPRAAGALALAALLLGPIVRFVVLRNHPQDMGSYELWTPLRIDSIVAGCLLAVVSVDQRFRDATHTRPGTALLLAVAAVLGIGANFLVGVEIETYGATIEPFLRALFIVTIVWLSISHYASWWGRILETRPLVIIGLLSYSLYLWQQPFLRPGAIAGFGDGLLAIALTVACAAASYNFIEKPFLRLKDKARR